MPFGCRERLFALGFVKVRILILGKEKALRPNGVSGLALIGAYKLSVLSACGFGKINEVFGNFFGWTKGFFSVCIFDSFSDLSNNELVSKGKALSLYISELGSDKPKKNLWGKGRGGTKTSFEC